MVGDPGPVEAAVSTTTRRILFWTPRILAILFAIFLSLFALDVFAESHGFWPTVGALLLHLVPALVVAAALAVAWRREWVGAVSFIGLAVFYVAWTWGRFPLITYVTVAGPLALVGLLFLFGWMSGPRPRTQ